MQWLENTSLLKFICRGVAIFFSVDGRNPDLPAATQTYGRNTRSTAETQNSEGHQSLSVETQFKLYFWELHIRNPFSDDLSDE